MGWKGQCSRIDTIRRDHRMAETLDCLTAVSRSKVYSLVVSSIKGIPVRMHVIQVVIKGTVIFLLIGLLIWFSQKTAADKPEPIEAGKWVNVAYIEHLPPQFRHGGVSHVEIRTGESWTIVGIGKETVLHVGGQFANDKTPLFGHAVIDVGFADIHTFVRQQGGRLIVQTYTTFKDASGRKGYGRVETFEKAE